MAKINFFSENISFNLPGKRVLKDWIVQTCREEGALISNINFIFCSDDYLQELNSKYLKHKSLTDIITFSDDEFVDKIGGEIYISVERVKENAEIFHEPFEREIKRVVIHGVLHLIGYKDKVKKDRVVMRSKEDYYLQRFDESVKKQDKI